MPFLDTTVPVDQTGRHTLPASLSPLLLAFVEVVELGVLLPDPLLHQRDELVLLQRLRAGRREHLLPEGDTRGAPVRLSPLAEFLVHLRK